MTTLKDLEITYDKPNWCPGCVVPNTFIQSNPSAILVTQLKEKERVVGTDGKGHEITEYFVHEHDGVVYKIKSKYFGETTLTSDHPVLAVRRKHKKLHNKEFKSEWIEAAELKKGDYLLYPVLKEERNVTSMDLLYKKKIKDTRSKKLPKKINISEDLYSKALSLEGFGVDIRYPNHKIFLGKGIHIR